ncbi:hypothetical protein [Curtobacterium sp. MCBD17_032]|uniref:hypothetical protein n=1 Tax=Curtobacterium sp. MCBD17_032 TaxID=2175659 RepID=UPI000DA99162|nr:hypothetical protein [Curtobacterium sp. MCBD17_032]PZE87066.1 hypothetical protein DEI91_01880 [Curtobacterium sp. MCBD17_032]
MDDDQRPDTTCAERTAWVGRRASVLAIATVTIALLTGCVPIISGPSPAPSRSDVSVTNGVRHTGPAPTAMSRRDGVETWDLTGPPSVEAFGIRTEGASPFVGAYSATTPGGRPVRFLLPGGREVRVTATEVIFDALDNDEEMTDRSGEVTLPEGRSFHLDVHTVPVDGAAAGVAGYRDVLRQLDLPETSVSELEEKVASADSIDPVEASQQIGAGISVPTSGGLDFGVSSTFRPNDEPPLFALRLSGAWDAVAIP